MIRFLRMTSTDAPILSEIGTTSLLESHGHSAPADIMQKYVDAKFSVDACRNELGDEHNIFYAVLYNNSTAGYFKIIPNAPNLAVQVQRSTKLERLYLLKKYYDLKLGAPLLQKSIELSQSAGDTAMWLNVWKENFRAIRFYEKNGFKIIGEADFPLTETRSNPNWVMMKEY